MIGRRYVEEIGSAAILAATRLAGVTPEVNLRECETHMPLPSVNKAAHTGFETQRRRHQKSKTGVSVSPQKGLMSSKKKNRNAVLIFYKIFTKVQNIFVQSVFVL